MKFHLRVENAAHDGSPANGFIQHIRPAERMALFSRCRTLCLPPGKTVISAGQRQTHLHLVVSGSLKAASYHTVEQKPRFQRQVNGSLGEGDIFGDIYPFTEELPAQAYIETVTRVELLSISRRRLVQVCRKYPNVERALIRLSRIRSHAKAMSPTDLARKGERYLMPTKLSLELLPSAPEEAPIFIEGYSQDLSISGVSFVPERNGHGPDHAWRSMADRLVDREVRVTIPNDDLSIAINGRIVRKRELVINGYRIFCFGIQFAEMPPRLRGAFFAFAEIRCASDRELESLLAFDSISS